MSWLAYIGYGIACWFAVSIVSSLILVRLFSVAKRGEAMTEDSSEFEHDWGPRK